MFVEINIKLCCGSLELSIELVIYVFNVIIFFMLSSSLVWMDLLLSPMVRYTHIFLVFWSFLPSIAHLATLAISRSASGWFGFGSKLHVFLWILTEANIQTKQNLSSNQIYKLMYLHNYF